MPRQQCPATEMNSCLAKKYPKCTMLTLSLSASQCVAILPPGWKCATWPQESLYPTPRRITPYRPPSCCRDGSARCPVAHRAPRGAPFLPFPPPASEGYESDKDLSSSSGPRDPNNPKWKGIMDMSRDTSSLLVTLNLTRIKASMHSY
jgi:hypothetical protein